MHVCYINTTRGTATTIANEIWIATALLQRDQAGRSDFSVQEIVERILREGLDEYRPGLQIHASSHCVASKAPNPSLHRFLHETARGRRRLYRTGDPFHPNRRNGRTHPSQDDLPDRYRYLVEWYETQFDSAKAVGTAPPAPPSKGSDLLRFLGSVPAADLHGLREAIRQGCEGVDSNEW